MNQITAATLHAQHQVLESLFQQLVSVSGVPGQDLTALARIMDNLITAFVQHCSDEERFMADMDYPELTGHRWQHDVLKSDAERLCKHLRSGSITLPEIVEGFRTIVVDHMEQTDTEMFRYAQSRHESASA